MLSKNQMEILEVEKASEMNSEMFLKDIPNYKFIGKDQWISQFDFSNDEDLRGKEMWRVHGFKLIDGKRLLYSLLVSDFLIKEDPGICRTIINKQIEDQIKHFKNLNL